MLFTVILAMLAALSAVLTVWQWLVARRFPLHQRVAEESFAPAVTVFKPLKGCDAETERCLRSWFEQSYAGRVQILLGVASAEDPVCAVVRKLVSEYPAVQAELAICPKPLGPNAKVSTLVQLQSLARHDVWIVSDADVRVSPDLLANIVAPLRDPGCGLVNCFYELANPATWALEWEAVAVNADFWSQVLQARSLKPLDFALGAVMASTRSRIVGIGGFAALVDYLADDYQLGHRIARQGGRIVLCPVVVECWSPPMNWQEVWRHQLRWARTIRVCQPAPFFFSVLSNATFWPFLWLAARPSAAVFGAALFLWLARVLTARANQARLTRSRVLWTKAWLVPVKDLLLLPIWALAVTGQTIEWRGRQYRVRRDGTLEGVGTTDHRPLTTGQV